MMDEQKRVMFQEYMDKIRRAAMRHCLEDGGLYAGKDGCLRLAREVGYALPDISRRKDDLFEMMRSTYGGVCVIAYDLKPPIDAKAWLNEMSKAIEMVLS